MHFWPCIWDLSTDEENKTLADNMFHLYIYVKKYKHDFFMLVLSLLFGQIYLTKFAWRAVEAAKAQA